MKRELKSSRNYTLDGEVLVQFFPTKRIAVYFNSYWLQLVLQSRSEKLEVIR